jgi:general secretion pathway protein J
VSLDAPVGRAQSGFTLIELLLALAMTALIGASSYAALEGVGRSRQAFEEKAAELAQLQRFLTVIGSDIRQASGVQNRAANGELESALAVNDGAETLLLLNRRGWHNPLAIPRSEMQRVYYRFDGEQVFRGYWEAFDRADDGAFRERPLLADVVHIGVRALPAQQTTDIERQWLPQWPGGEPSAALPAALEITIELKTLGELKRVYELLPQS